MSLTCPLLFVVRHGQTAFNKERRFQGQAQVPLNDTGRIQAERSGKILANILSTYEVTLQAFSSDLVRARETAAIIKETLASEVNINLSIAETSALREFNVGLFENHTVSELEKKCPDLVNDYFSTYEVSPATTKYPGDLGESREMVAKRLAPIVNMINESAALYLQENSQEINSLENCMQKKPNIYLLITHGGAIDVLLEIIEGMPNKQKRILGNGDLLILAPQRLSSKEDSESKNVLKYNYNWKVLRHYQVGDNLAARSNYSAKKDIPA